MESSCVQLVPLGRSVLLDRVELDLDQRVEGQRAHGVGLATGHDLRGPEEQIPARVDETVARHVAGQQDRGAEDIVGVQFADAQHAIHLGEDLLDLLFEITDDPAVDDPADRAGEVEVVADLHAGRKRLTDTLHREDPRGLLFLGHCNLPDCGHSKCLQIQARTVSNIIIPTKMCQLHFGHIQIALPES